MSKAKLIKRLEWYYPTERFHAFGTFPFIVVCLLFYNSVQDILFLIYGLLACIFILYQGQHYWKLKLYRLTNKVFGQQKNLNFFRRSKKINLYLIILMPLVFLVQLYLSDWTIKPENLLLWAILANVFAILEHINYYFIQLSIDNAADVNYVRTHKRLKKASLAKDLRDNEI